MAKKKRSSRLLRRVVIFSLVILAVFFVARSMGFFSKKKLPEVIVAEVKKVDITEKVTASGRIQPEIEVIISPDVSGEVIAVFIEEGDSVQKGQLLFRIRPDNLQAIAESSQATVNARQANLAQAQASLAEQKANLIQATNDFERNKKLYEDKVISEAEYQNAQAAYQTTQQRVASEEQNVRAARFNLDNAQASLRQSNDNLSRTEIYAPMSGIVSQLNVELGETVVGTAQMAGTEMLTIADLTNMEVQVDVNENDIIRIRKGQPVIIDVDSYTSTGRKFDGLVTEIANTANDASSADAVTEFQVKIRINQSSYEDLLDPANNQFPFRPGMTAAVDIVTNEKKGILSVPVAAVTTRNPRGSGQGGGQRGQGQAGRAQSASNRPNAEKSDKKKNDQPSEIVYIYNEEEGVVKAQEVETGISDFENIEILKGLKSGAKIVSGPFIVISRQLEDGKKVELQDPNKSQRGRGGRGR